MRYESTRTTGKMGATETIITGIAQDGGLFLPESIPFFSKDDLTALGGVGYAERAALVLSRYMSEFSYEELLDYATRAYASGAFTAEEVAPVRPLYGKAHLLELYHGPTCAFKDFALQILPYLLTASLKKQKEESTVVILVATSGDTGKAALEGFQDVPGTRICVFYPEGAISPMQELQMTSQQGQNVMVYAIRGNFDDAQTAVKQIFADEAFQADMRASGMRFSSANSINWGRLVPQIAYYYSAYCDLVNQGRIAMGDICNVVVPTGNFGNILAAYLAKLGGLPIGRLICASNSNNVLSDFIGTGTYDRNRKFYVTTSPSMDILISSNLERLLYLLSGRDHAKLNVLMQSLREQGSYIIDDVMRAQLQDSFWGGCADDAETAATIRRVFEDTNALIDPHTAVAVKVYEDYVKETGDDAPTIIASTASPYKFADTVLRAITGKQDIASNDSFSLIRELERTTNSEAPTALSGLADKQARFSEVVNPDDMRAAIRRWLKEEGEYEIHHHAGRRDGR